jgi:hypothetical protein
MEYFTANFVASLLILSTLMMEPIRSSKTSVITRTTQRHCPEVGVLQQTDHLKMCRSSNIWEQQ